MKVLLISANRERINMLTMPLGLGLVAAATRRAGHRVAFLDLVRETDAGAAIRDAVAAHQPEVIGISVRNVDDQCRLQPRFLLDQAKSAVDECRRWAKAPIVVGGAGYSIFPDAALAYLGADFGIAGDGEVAFPELLERLGRGEDPSDLPGVHAPGGSARETRHHPATLDDLPLWDEALEAGVDRSAADLWVPVQSRRGCPNDCSYCSTAAIQGRGFRLRSPRSVIDDMVRLADAGFPRFYFVDNSFNLPEAQAFELCRLLSACGRRLEWRCILYPHLVSEELVRAMAAAGCVEVSLGFESGNARVLRELNKRFSPDDVRLASDLLAASGIRRMGFLLLGGPGETRESVEESLAFAQSLGLDALRLTVGIRIYPDTALARRAVADGAIAADDDLLHPKFYLAPGLEPWIHERVAQVEGAIK